MKLRVECSTDTTDSACKQPLESVEVRLHRWMCENVEKQSKVSAVESRAFRVRCRIGNIPACAFEMLQKRSHYLSGAWQGLHSANHGAVEPKQKPIVTVVTLKASKVGANNSCQPRSNFFGAKPRPYRAYRLPLGDDSRLGELQQSWCQRCSRHNLNLQGKSIPGNLCSYAVTMFTGWTWDSQKISGL